MIAIPPTNYSYNATANTITFSGGYSGIGIEQIFSIYDINNGQLLYAVGMGNKFTLPTITNSVLMLLDKNSASIGDRIRIMVDM